jgi:hypothetical protein
VLLYFLLFHIDLTSHAQIGQKETEEVNYMVFVKFSSIHKLGIGYDEFGQACESPWYHHQYSPFRVAESRPQ